MRTPILIMVFAFVPAMYVSVNAGAPTGITDGKMLFTANCVACHREDGTRGRWGAKNLQTSQLDDVALLTIISNGRGIMPRWSKKLDQNQVKALVVYIKTLRSTGKSNRSVQ